VSETRVPQILVGTIIPTVIGSFFVIAKLYTRVIITKSWGGDDTFLTLGWVSSPPFSCSSFNPILLTYRCLLNHTSIPWTINN
jgi:hypothetical protein